MAAARVGARRHCCVRFSLREREGKLIEMSRLDFSRKLLLGVLGYVPGDINCLMVLPMGKGFDVSFRTPGLLASFWNKLESVKEKFEMFNIERLTDDAAKTVVIKMYNETVEVEDILTWLGRYCIIRGPAQKVVDLDGIWIGSWRIPVRLAEDKKGYGGFRHLPSLMVLGENRGLVYYQGQPKLCRKCGEYGHLAEACKALVCNRCRELGHLAAECPTGRRCNLCGSAEHMFRYCPDSFANRTKKNRVEVRERQREEEAKAQEEGEKEVRAELEEKTKELSADVAENGGRVEIRAAADVAGNEEVAEKGTAADVAGNEEVAEKGTAAEVAGNEEVAEKGTAAGGAGKGGVVESGTAAELAGREGVASGSRAAEEEEGR
ncbi:hypothetical protein ANANG_G00307410, partial [Anguilla anguilla]